jgi:hypothetical protein
VFTAQSIKGLMDTKPSKPFRIRLSDGNIHEPLKHDAGWVTRNHVEIGTVLDAAGFAENAAHCAIIRIEKPHAA